MTKLIFVAAIAIVSLYGYGASQSAFAQEVSVEPSKQAVCGYQWRMHKIEHPEAPKDRAAYVDFMHKACGMTGKVRNDDAIKTYLDAHPEKKVSPDWHGALPLPGLLARGKKKLIDDTSEG